MSIDIIQTLIH